MKAAYYRRANSFSRSYNAMLAESNGRYPRSVAAKKLGLSLKAFDAGCVAANYSSTEWHHVGKYANVVNYYDTTELANNPIFWRGAKTRANADYSRAMMRIAVQKRLAIKMPVIFNKQVSFKRVWESEYEIDAVNDHAFSKGIADIVSYRAKLLQTLQPRIERRFRMFFLYSDGTILNKGKRLTYSEINWNDYIVVGVIENGVKFIHKSEYKPL